jgi:putative transposase
MLTPARRYPPDPRREQWDLRLAARSRRVAWTRTPRRALPDRAADAPRRPAGLAALPRRARTTDSRHGYPIAPNRLARNFQAAAPNQIWLADLTYIPTGEGWLYLAAILDMHTRKIVGWSMRQTLHTEIALEALHMAIERQRPPPGLIHHSDRGIQYAAEAYRQALAASGISPSMSRKGDCWDNAPMESFFHTLKTERVHHRVYATRADARRDLFGYIEGFYNPRRLHSALGYISPADMERRAA